MQDNQRRIISAVQSYIGCSSKTRVDELAVLCARGVDNPKTVKSWLQMPGFSNCAFFALGIWHACGVNHPLLSTPYETGKAMAWVLKIATELGALMKYHPDQGAPPPGALLHYATRGKNNDHVEFVIGEESHGKVPHAGGGRANCLIGSGLDSWSWNYGRPLQSWIDPLKLLPEVSTDDRSIA
jgi:hypothetical protein